MSADFHQDQERAWALEQMLDGLHRYAACVAATSTSEKRAVRALIRAANAVLIIARVPQESAIVLLDRIRSARRTFDELNKL